MYKTLEGKILEDHNVISRSRQEQMLNTGWDIRHVDDHESAQEAYDRISKANPGKIVRIYSATTAIRGYYSKYAMVRWPRTSKRKEIRDAQI